MVTPGSGDLQSERCSGALTDGMFDSRLETHVEVKSAARSHKWPQKLFVMTSPIATS